ncbi:hypothetical protein [Thiohalocapsa marina]|uniref:TubC N-terminal docking domain-related protein n=1 Tax=Thiohalocapsa marina TaxID=424902 RepID=UPI0036DF2E65
MNAAEILHTLTDQGFNMAVEGDRLTITPSSRLTDTLRAEIRTHKFALVELLTRPANDEPTPPPPATASRAEVEQWMDLVGETDPETRREVLANYGYPSFTYPDSGRRACRQCRNLEVDGGCRAARRGQIPNASKHYTWPAGIDALHRCIGFRPGLDDHDPTTTEKRP